MNQNRIETLRTQLNQESFAGAIVIPGPTLSYLTGQSFHLMERPIFLIVTDDQDPIMILPELEHERVPESEVNLQVVTYSEDDASRASAIQKAVELIGQTPRVIAVEPLVLRFFELELLHAAAPAWDFQSGEKLFTKLRSQKDNQEVAHLRRAIDIAQRALQDTQPLIKIGMSERELAAELVIQLLRAGSEPELPFQPIVASGPNSALPHATPTDRQLTAGDLLILDWGARSAGYVSDITRTYAIGEVFPEFEKVHQTVLESNRAGRSAVRPGVTCSAIDQAAREVIEMTPYGQYFIHRTGHGIGLEPHEPPNIRSGEMVPVQVNMTFTVEPGIYLPGKGGVRIEDNVIVTETGVETLTTLERTLSVLG